MRRMLSCWRAYRRWRLTGAAMLAGAATLVITATLATSAAAQQPTLAQPCEANGLTCMTAPLVFEQTAELPATFDFDTGWVPPNSDLQVRLQALLAASTRLSLRGDLLAQWPHAEQPGALQLRTPGRLNGGLMNYHYGLLVDAEGKVHISIWPFTYTWQGNIPYVPQVDFQVSAEQVFDSWAFEGTTSSSVSAPVTLAQVDVSALIGASIPGISGGFELDAAVALEVRYTHREFDIRHLLAGEVGEQVAGGAIVTKDGDSYAFLGLLPYEDYWVTAKGTLDYDGVLHLIPAFYVSLLGQNWSIPVADIPIAFHLTQSDWSFEPQRLRVPLPYLDTDVEDIDFGDIALGEETFRTFAVNNVGHHTLATQLSLADVTHFALYDDALQLAPGDKLQPVVRFVPTSAGEHHTTLLLTSNDAASPLRAITLHGHATAPDLPAPPPLDGQRVEGQCGCNVAGGSVRYGWSAAAGLLLLGLSGYWRRRRWRRSGRS